VDDKGVLRRGLVSARLGDNLPSRARPSASHHPGVDYGPEVDANAVIVVS